ncbi:unnamed protein product [Cuscuta europaea]|uniref:S-acyltransferase n=1 Tax=Cuscuta europaea TaxID=41803 RepID=A0A9P0ZKT1_CUSEU|nr:unnamed protein product [Cuscuta europaea]
MTQEGTKEKMLYQVWKGNNRFLFGGRLIIGSDVKGLFLSILLIVGPATAFCVQVNSIIAHKIEEHQDAGYWYLVLIIGVVLTVMALIFLFLTSSTEPGVIPRRSKPTGFDEDPDISTPFTEGHDKTSNKNLPKWKNVIVNGHTIMVKYCDTCLLYRPPRASHCSICNNCVQKYDHHCEWLGQCIGLRNFRFFYFFISTLTILSVYIFIISWIKLRQHGGGLGKAIQQDIVSDVLIVYCSIAGLCVGCLTTFHFSMICINQTTHENLRRQRGKEDNPYNKGILHNFKEVFFHNIPPSLVDFRSIVHEKENALSMKTNPPNPKGSINISNEKIE